MELFLSSYCSPSRSISQAVRDIAGLGVTRIELTGGCDHALYDEAELLGLARSHGLELVIHNYFPPQAEDFVLNLASEDPQIKARSLGMVTQAVELAQKCGRGFYSVHGGYWYEQSVKKGERGVFHPGPRAAASDETFYANLGQIARRILPGGFKLAVENAFPAHGHQRFSLLAEPDEIMRFCEFCQGHPSLGLLLDLGHLNVSARYLGFDKGRFLEELMTRYADKVFEVHVSANDGLCDAHRVNDMDCFELSFLREYQEALAGAVVVMEWQQCLGPGTVARFNQAQALLNGKRA